MKKNVAIILPLPLVLLAVLPATSAWGEEKTGNEEASPAPAIQAERFISEHRITIGGRTVEYVLDHMDLDPELRKNITVKLCEAGHMMYVQAPSMVGFKQDLAEFIE